MSLKSVTQTRWKIEPSRVILYPNGMSYILCVVLAIIFACLLLVYTRYEGGGLSSSLPLMLFLLLIVVLFWGHGHTYVAFDNRTQRMQKKLMGFIPVANVPFAELQGIQVVSNMYGGYNYRAFTKANRYGKGIVISSGYGKNDDPNALALVNTVVPVIHQYLDEGEGMLAPAAVSEPITKYQYFIYDQGTYTLKRNKIAGTLLGLALSGLGIYMLTNPPFFADLDTIRRWFVLLFLLICGPAIILGVFTRIVFDLQHQTVSRISPIGLGNRQYRFAEFTGFQTVRRSMNFIYSGTDVHMYFAPAGKRKEEVLQLSSFRNTRKIDRFIAEVQQIMKQQS